MRPHGFKYPRNSSRKSFRNAKFYFIRIADSCPAGHLCREFESARHGEVGRTRNDAQSCLLDQELFETPTLWDIRRDGDSPKAVASILGS